MSVEIIDKHGEPLGIGDRVMLDGAIVGTIESSGGEHPGWRVKIDGGGTQAPYLEPTGYRAPEVESLGDGVNQAMRAAQEQPS